MKRDNELIAVFMGGKLKGDCLPDIACRMSHEDYWLPLHGIVNYQLLRYHQKWDWLMPVVEKILYMPREYEGHYSYLSKIENGLLQVNHGMIYEGVIEFIKWFNTKHTKDEN